METAYEKWLKEQQEFAPKFKEGDIVLIMGDETGSYQIMGKKYEPLLGRDVYTLARGTKIRYAISSNIF